MKDNNYQGAIMILNEGRVGDVIVSVVLCEEVKKYHQGCKLISACSSYIKDMLNKILKIAGVKRDDHIGLIGTLDFLSFLKYFSKVGFIVSIDIGGIHITVALNKPDIAIMCKKFYDILSHKNKNEIFVSNNEEVAACGDISRRIVPNELNLKLTFTSIVNQILQIFKLIAASAILGEQIQQLCRKFISRKDNVTL